MGEEVFCFELASHSSTPSTISSAGITANMAAKKILAKNHLVMVLELPPSVFSADKRCLQKRF